MTTPCTGFALCRLLRIAEPLGSEEYVEFEEAQDKTVPGPRSPLCLWSYFEGRAIDKVGDDLPLISTGLCGKPLLPQNSGLIRLATPRKIVVKSAKALAKISFAVNFWQAIQPSGYGFRANVTPAVAHPRQAAA